MLATMKTLERADARHEADLILAEAEDEIQRCMRDLIVLADKGKV